MSSQADILIKIYPRYHTIIAFYNVALGITLHIKVCVQFIGDYPLQIVWSISACTGIP